ncbi:hypothetical protein DFJ43DRAFT_1157365 [Lentinula guzmanii]|uniref:Chromo domain-containing protein n=1 Tax=Lentinula guzmanii TaxID=2804957 RepID=A0AA38JIK0_9AGAR|nr:hypothetical protein DFJ43DRAFT_1157365 [Lentinula guzmanii]
MASPGVNESEREAVKALVLQMEARRNKVEHTTMDSKSQSSEMDPAPSTPIPTRPVAPTKPPKPIIGKLPANYVPPQEHSIGILPKEDSRNFRYKAPIGSEVAVSRVIEAGFNSTVSVRHEDLLAIAPDYCRQMKESVTGKCIGIEGNFVNGGEGKIGQQYDYLIHWKDQPNSEDSWVPLSDLPNSTNETIERFHRRHPRTKRPPSSVLSSSRQLTFTPQSDDVEIDSADPSRPTPPIADRRSMLPAPINPNLRINYEPPTQTMTRSGRVAKPPTQLNL